MTVRTPGAGAGNESSRGVLLRIAYEGTNFVGWARQPGARSVEETVMGAIRSIDPSATPLRGTSRTDSGVHAEGQLAAFDSALSIAPRGWVLALNAALPDDVAAREARWVERGFHPRFATRSKRYRYELLLDRVRDPSHAKRAWRIGWPLDLGRLRDEAQTALGTHDFAAFRSAHDARAVTVRTIFAIDVIPSPTDRIVSIVVSGDAFLYNMVRIMVGTLVDVARGNLAPGAFSRALATKERKTLGTTAPAHGLTLESIDLALPPGVSEPWPPR